MKKTKKSLRLRIGSWVLSKALEDTNCIDCHREIPRAERSWRCVRRSGLGRRVCTPCMEQRQAVMNRSIATAAQEVAA